MKNMFVFLFLFVFSFHGFAQDSRTHKVESGDTVYKLAKEYNTTEEAIYALNPDAKVSIRLGQILVMPSEKTGGEEGKAPLRFEAYVVKQKETIFGISQQNGINMDDLKKHNPYLYKEELGMGDTIQIPVYTKGKPEPINYNESIQNSKFGNLLHVVLPKETAYGIARKYGIKVDRLQELNPSIGTLQPGQVLMVSRKEKSNEPSITNEEAFTYYTVKPYNAASPETIFSMTRKFGISKDSLYALNPHLKKEGLKAGMKLKVPARGGKIASSNLTAEITDLEKSIVNYETQELVVLLPFHLKNFQSDSLSSQKETMKDNRLARISLDFYSGVLLALEKAKSQGLSVNLRTYDTEQSKIKISSIIQGNDFSKVKAVIGPLLNDQIEVAAQQFSRKDIPVFSPLTKKEMNAYDNLFQTRPTDEQLSSAMINYLDSLHTNENMVIVADGKHSAIKNKLQIRFPSAKTIGLSGEYSEKGDLVPSLQKGTKNWIILEAENIGLIGSVLANLNSLASAGYDISLYTTNRNDSYDSDEISNLNLSRLKFTFPSFTKDLEPKENVEFIESYKEKNGIKPSKFAVRGYDLTYDILLRLAATKNFEESMEAGWITEYNENKFHYIEKEKGGYVNTAMYIVQYQKDLTTKPIQL